MSVLHDFKCTTCDRVFEDVVDVAQLPVGPPCPTCASLTERIWLPPRVRWTPDAVVVYLAPDGSFRFPGETGGAGCAKYDAMGYQRIEARGFPEVRALEKRMNTSESSHMTRLEERRLELQEQGLSLRRSEIRRGLEQGFRIPEARLNPRTNEVEHTGRMTTVRMRGQGRDAMRAMMTREDAKGPRRVGTEPGIHIEAYSNDRSNREESRDARGHRHRD